MNLLTLAALVWIALWSAQQRPALPDQAKPRLIGAAVGTVGPALHKSAPTTTGEAALATAQPSAARTPTAAGPVLTSDPLATVVGYRPAVLTAGPVAR